MNMPIDFSYVKHRLPITIWERVNAFKPNLLPIKTIGFETISNHQLQKQLFREEFSHSKYK